MHFRCAKLIPDRTIYGFERVSLSHAFSHLLNDIINVLAISGRHAINSYPSDQDARIDRMVELDNGSLLAAEDSYVRSNILWIIFPASYQSLIGACINAFVFSRFI